MPGVMMPQNQDGGSLGTVLKIGGAVGGGILGGPAGAAAGYSLGGAAGGMVDPAKAPMQPVQSTVQNSAIDRRVDSLSQDPSMQLAQANTALKQMPAADQAAYGPTLAAAQQRAAYGGV